MAHATDDLFTEDVDSEQEDWTFVMDTSLKVPQVSAGQEISSPQQTAARIQQKAIETALEAAGLTGQQIVLLMKALAEDSGRLSNCDTVDDMIKLVVRKYPILQGAAAGLSELRRSFNVGRRLAERQRSKPIAAPVKTLEQRKQPEVKASTIVRENFAGFEDVPLDETDLDCEPEHLRKAWDQQQKKQ